MIGDGGDIMLSLLGVDAIADGEVLGNVVGMVAIEQGVEHVGAGEVELPVAPGAFVEQNQAVVGVGGGNVKAQV
jgi:hypothetical protein